jgi:uncharacterized protein with NRDE domain
MCTVTFIPVRKSVFITHNRDEQNLRTKAFAPDHYLVHGTSVLFPKDGKAGGSWAGMNEFGHAAVLLNGAFEKHIPVPPYRKSRGLIFVDLLSSPDLLLSFQATDLRKIEPFTIVYWNGQELYELRWDAEKRFILQLDGTASHMWSSATLYDDVTINKRLSWFKQWKQKYAAPAIEDIIAFHLNGGDGDHANDLRMSRDGQLSTLSITAMEISRQQGKMKYMDLSDGSTKDVGIIFKKSRVESQ